MVFSFVGIALFVLPALFAQADSDTTPGSSGNSQTVAVLDTSMSPEASPLRGAHIRVIENTLVVDNTSNSQQVVTTQEGGDNGSVINTYTVQPGDTISDIAERFSVSQDTIIWANDLRSSNIRVGQELVILPISGVLHTVERGDTISGLAKTYNADVYDIESYNGFEEGDVLKVGEEVTIPYGTIPKPQVTVARTTRSSGGTQTSGATARVWNNKTTIWTNGVRTTPLRNTNGPNYDSYYSKPLIGYSRSRGLHGNNAIDWAAPAGTPVLAAANGTVNIAKWGGWNGGYGKYVVINHANGTQTLYAHMSSVTVTPGQSIAAGTQLGAVGTTGNSTGNHLHFEVRGAQNPWR